MSGVAETPSGSRAAMGLRWAICFGLVLIIHVGAALFLLRHGLQPGEQAGASSPDAITLDLAPEIAAPSPAPTPSELPASPEPPEPPAPVAVTEPQPPAPVLAPAPPPLTPDAPAPELTPVTPPQTSVPVLSEPPPPPPPRPAAQSAEHHPPAARPMPPRQTMSRPATVPAAKPNQSAASSAPASPAPEAPSPGAVSGWRNALIQKLQQAKRYPEVSREHDEQGVATVRFTMDRDGHVLSVNLIHGSGSQTLDQEAMAMFRRAEPLPPLPDGSGNTLTLTIPVTFSLQ
jgi:periplasmic protein TonB